MSGGCTRLCVDFEIERAIEGRAGSDYFEDCDLWQYWLNTGRSPSDGEIGCYASHLRLWQLCVASGEALVVMEDDAAPLATFTVAFGDSPSAHRALWVPAPGVRRAGPARQDSQGRGDR